MSALQTAGIALREGRDLDRQANLDYQAEMNTANAEDERNIRATLGKLAMEFDRIKAAEEAAKVAKASGTAESGGSTKVPAPNMVHDLTDGTSDGGALGRATSTQDPNMKIDFTSQQGYADGGKVTKPFRGVFDAQEWDNNLATLPSIYRDTIKDAVGVDPRDPDFQQKAQRNAQAMEFMRQKAQEMQSQMPQQQQMPMQPHPMSEYQGPPQPQVARFVNGGYVRRGYKGYANGGVVNSMDTPSTMSGALNNGPMYPGFANGGQPMPPGEVEGEGTGTSDSIDARISDGEYIIPADVVEAKGVEFFDRIVEKYHTPVEKGE